MSKIFPRYISEKGLVSWIYIKNPYSSVVKKRNKSFNGYSTDFTIFQKIKKQIYEWPTSTLVIREMQIKLQ